MEVLYQNARKIKTIVIKERVFVVRVSLCKENISILGT